MHVRGIGFVSRIPSSSYDRYLSFSGGTFERALLKMIKCWRSTGLLKINGAWSEFSICEPKSSRALKFGKLKRLFGCSIGQCPLWGETSHTSSNMTKSGGFLSVNTASQEVLLRIGILALICVLGSFQFSSFFYHLPQVYFPIIHSSDAWLTCPSFSSILNSFVRCSSLWERYSWSTIQNIVFHVSMDLVSLNFLFFR